jgi:phage protein D
VLITRGDGDQHRWSRADRDAYSGVRAWYNNLKTGGRKAVVAGISGKAKELRTTFASEADALAVARAQWMRIQRGIFDFEITLAYGRADNLHRRQFTRSLRHCFLPAIQQAIPKALARCVTAAQNGRVYAFHQ